MFRQRSAGFGNVHSTGHSEMTDQGTVPALCRNRKFEQQEFAASGNSGKLAANNFSQAPTRSRANDPVPEDTHTRYSPVAQDYVQMTHQYFYFRQLGHDWSSFVSVVLKRIYKPNC